MKLFFESGPQQGTVYDIEDGVVSVGRAAVNDIVLNDQMTSLMHCRIRVGGAHPVITNLGSTNGTWVNGERIVSAQLHDGDILQVGTSRIRVQLKHQGLDKERAGLLEEDLERDGQDRDIFGSVTYSLTRKISDGGMGTIYEAMQFGAEGFMKRVAIKTILPEFKKHGELVSSFVGEARLVANLVHQNIVQIHHLGRHKGGYYIAMEYIDGITVTDFLGMHARLIRQVPVDLAVFITSRVARGLEYAHKKHDTDGNPLNLVHRDVSPNNIMIDTGGEVKLADFGVAKASKYMVDNSNDLVGCVEFMSPEQARCDDVDGRSDIFSLGLVFYELLTGTRLFRADGGHESRALDAVIDGTIPDPRNYRPELPDEVAEIVLKMLQKDVVRRYQLAGEVAYDLECSMYRSGYGPTVVKLSAYVAELKEQELTDGGKRVYPSR
jgi:serine/threonine-protein kinase